MPLYFEAYKHLQPSTWLVLKFLPVMLSFRHPLTWSHSSIVHLGKHFPPHFKPKEPGGQGSSQESPKNPALHSEISLNIHLSFFNYYKYKSFKGN